MDRFEALYRLQVSAQKVAESLAKDSPGSLRDVSLQDSVIVSIKSIEKNGGGNDNDCYPDAAYKRKVLSAVVAAVEKSGGSICSDAFTEVYGELLQTSNVIESNPNNVVRYQTFPQFGSPPLAIRVFPQHNDVSLRIWEANCFLIEYIFAHPELVEKKSFLELGAGCGMLGLVFVGCLQAKKAVVTDYSNECLENMLHNVEINERWLDARCSGPSSSSSPNKIDSSKIEIRNLDWTGVDETTFDDNLDMIIGCDILYDPSDIPHIVKSCELFLFSGSRSRKILLATTYRNSRTFDKLLAAIDSSRLKYVDLTSTGDGSERKKVPQMFPFDEMFVQGRHEVNLFLFSTEE